jgi:hypothetical protein
VTKQSRVFSDLNTDKGSISCIHLLLNRRPMLVHMQAYIHYKYKVRVV